MYRLSPAEPALERPLVAVLGDGGDIVIERLRLIDFGYECHPAEIFVFDFAAGAIDRNNRQIFIERGAPRSTSRS